MPHGATTHDHVPRRSADCTAERSHVISAVEYHPFPSEPVDVWSLKWGVGVVALQIEGRLVIDKDEQDVRPLGIRSKRASAEQHQQGYQSKNGFRHDVFVAEVTELSELYDSDILIRVL